MLLLTWHGTLVCLPEEGGGLVHLPLPLPQDAPPPLEIDVGAAAPAEKGPRQHPRLGPIALRPATPGGVRLTVSRYGRFLGAAPDQTAMAFDRDAAERWEWFLAIAPDDVALLQHILRSRWIVRHTRAVLPRHAAWLGDGFVLHLMGQAIPLERGLAGLLPDGEAAGPGARPAIRLPGPDGAVELVPAEPRSSPLIETDRWPVRARRQAELMVLAVHRQLLGREPDQEVFEADTRSLLEDGGAAGLDALIERMAPLVPAAPGSAAHAVPRSWALREAAPWLAAKAPREATHAAYAALNATTRWASLFRFEDGRVTLEPKPDAAAPTRLHAERREHYLAFFQAVAPLLPSGFRATVCMGMADTLPKDLPYPVFAFQKQAGGRSLLLPDVDFLAAGFYADDRHRDTIAFADKVQAAVFAGATTGGLITPEVVATRSLPRLRAADYFQGHARVDFRLPKIVQTSTPAVAALLAKEIFCRQPKLSWQEQLRWRFLLSIDGNGATCSRVALALASQSVLVKYESPNLLYYFHGLQPWLHYVPVAADGDVDRVLGMADRDLDLFAGIAAAGRDFAQTHLTREAALAYTAALLALLPECFDDDPARADVTFEPPQPPQEPARRSSATHALAHIQDHGDVLTGQDGWTGEPGSTRWVEGFAIFLDVALPADAVTYQAAGEGGVLSPPGRDGAYVGTRGDNAPIYGLRVTASPDATFDVTCEARFVDGSGCAPVPSGQICLGPAGVALEAFRFIVRQK